MASATRECSWEQTYTGTCSVGSTRRVNEVEFIVRDLFTCPSVRVRDVRAAVVFAIDIEDEIESEKYYLHLVVRGLPWGGGAMMTHWMSPLIVIRGRFRIFILVPLALLYAARI